MTAIVCVYTSIVYKIYNIQLRYFTKACTNWDNGKEQGNP